MRLSRIYLTNFRAYPVGVLDVPENGLVLVAGANNSGKSAFLSALDVVVRGTGFSDMGFGGNADWSIALTFMTTDVAERFRIVESLKSLSDTFHDPGAFSFIEVTFAPFQGSAAAIEVKFGPDAKSMNPIAALDRENSVPMLPSALIPQQTGGMELRHVTNAGPSLDNFGAGHPVTLMLAGVRGLRSSFYHIEALRPGAAPTSVFRSTPVLDPTGVNLAAVLSHLRDNDRRLFAKVAETLGDLVPELGELAFRSNDAMHEIVFDDPATPDLRQNLQNLGTGVEQLLLTLVVGIAQPQARIILIEEPETALEAGAQRALLGLLQQWAQDRLFIVSTHSTAMIDWSSAASGQMYHVRRRKGRSSINKVGRDFRHLLGELGVRLSDVMSAETILVVEGTTDRDVLGVLFPQLVQTPSVAIVPGGGGNSDRLAHIPQTWLDEADALSERRIRFLRDRDELSPTQIAKREAKGVVRVLPRRELENYLLDAAALHRVLLAEHETLDASEADIEAALQTAANELRERVVLGRVWWQLPPIRLVDQDLRRELADVPDKLDQLIAKVSDALPDRVTMTERVKELWSEAKRNVDNEWQDHWRSLAPGADVLNKVFVRFLGRDYKKDVDGPKIARAITQVPEELKKIIDDMTGSEG